MIWDLKQVQKKYRQIKQTPYFLIPLFPYPVYYLTSKYQNISPWTEGLGYKCCVHVRDFMPGQTIPDQIVACIQESRSQTMNTEINLQHFHYRRVIIVLSEAYCQQYWTRMELRQAQSQSISDNIEVRKYYSTNIKIQALHSATQVLKLGNESYFGPY